MVLPIILQRFPMSKLIILLMSFSMFTACLTGVNHLTVDLDYMVRCNSKLIQNNQLDDNTINDVIWGTYDLITDDESESFILTKKDQYYYVKKDIIYEHGELIFSISDKIYIDTKSTSDVEGWYLYCDDVLYDIIRNKTWYRLCKCSF